MKVRQLAAALSGLTFCLLLIPADFQDVQGRHHRPSRPVSEDNIKEVDRDFKQPERTRHGALTRDSLPPSTGGGPGIGQDYKPNRDEDEEKADDGLNPKSLGGYGGGRYNRRPGGSGGGGGGYHPKPIIGGGRNPTIDDDYKIKPVGGGYDYRPTGGGYDDRPIDSGKDAEDDKHVGGGGHKPKPTGGRDDERPIGIGGYKPVRGGYDRPVGGGYDDRPVGGGYDDKPVGGGYDDRPVVGGGYDDGTVGGGYDDGTVGGGYDDKPVGGGYDDRPVGGGYDDRPVGGGGYNPKPGGGGGYNPKPGGGGGYNRKPIGGGKDDGRPVGGGKDDESYRRPGKPDLGGYNNPKEDDYDDESGKDDRKPVNKGDGECTCVPYYQCQEGHIVTDGAGIIDARKRPEPDEELPLDGKFNPPSCGPFHVCCNTPETSTVKPYEHRCGLRNPSGINSRILSPGNKGEADFGEWPWQAAVLKTEGKVNIFQCGGVLIDKYHVLTVAHCVFHLYQYNDYPLKVRLGEWDTQTTTEFLAHEDYKVAKIIVHPEFRNTSLWNDIALLRLEDPVLFAPHIDTVCLPKYDENFAGQNCVVTGWGKDAYKGGSFSNVMKEVAIGVIDNYKCEEMLRKTRLGRFFQLHEGFVCAGGEYGLDSCKGDGGGPLVCYRKDKSYALAGIVSWGIDCGQPGVPGVYVKIQKFLDWISKNTGVKLDQYWPNY